MGISIKFSQNSRVTFDREHMVAPAILQKSKIFCLVKLNWSAVNFIEFLKAIDRPGLACAPGRKNQMPAGSELGCGK
ncbi:MAG: hypothetical protein D6715_02945 [Calditrichaeota bacterium]|nr:MAG: hypothetical protein D6715_02945 [Calditrichota bacterium]